MQKMHLRSSFNISNNAGRDEKTWLDEVNELEATTGSSFRAQPARIAHSIALQLHRL